MNYHCELFPFIHEGTIAVELSREDATEERIMLAATGQTAEAAGAAPRR